MTEPNAKQAGTVLVSGAGRKAAWFVFIYLLLHVTQFSSWARLDAEVVSKILEAYGSVYGVLAAFITYVVWTQYYQTEVAVYREASSLGDILNLARHLSDQTTSAEVFERGKQYAGHVISKEWEGKPETTTAETDLQALSQIIYGAKIADPKDQTIFEKLIDLYDRLSEARDERVGLGKTRIPSALWVLLSFTSYSFLAFFLLLPPSLVGYAAVAVVAFTTQFLLGIINDLDRPFEGAWQVSQSPFKDVIRKFHS